MTKHNGKARKAGERVGATLAAKNKKTAPTTQAAISAQFKHTTDAGTSGARNMQSVLDRNDLDELMAIADLADRDFTAERTQVVVVSTGVIDPLAEARAAEERAAAEARNAHRLALPRRPPWTADMTAEQLDLQERTSFLTWRRNLAQLEEEERLVLTPFEKNLEVWRQLWRVLERSDIVVQVVDARDPLLYRSEDLEAYARALHASKSSLLLLNKADLLPPHVRAAWADYFDKEGVEYAFWSAYAVIQEQAALRSEAAALGVDAGALKKLLAARQEQEQQQQQRQQHAQQQQRAQSGVAAGPSGSGAAAQSYDSDARIRVLDVDQLLDLFERKCAAAVAAAGEADPRAAEGPERRHMVGLVGYPNVGKSSTINALFGAKKTAVAPTPGKTKHFQTLHVSPRVVLCDCPGLVMPKFARSRAEMVAAGVVPIDRLTDIRQPTDVVAGRVGGPQLERVYGIRLPPPPRHLPRSAPPSAEAVLRAFATLRGWTAGSGLPDETRAGRHILRDYTAGKLVYCVLPPGSAQVGWVPGGAPVGQPAAAAAPRQAAAAASSSGPAAQERARGDDGSDEEDDDDDDGGGGDAGSAGEGSSGEGGEAAAGSSAQSGAAGHSGGAARRQAAPASTAAAGAAAAGAAAGAAAASGEGGAGGDGAGAAASVGDLDAADLDLLQDLGLGPKPPKQKRPDYKFNKKAARSKGDRGQLRAEGGYDGAGLVHGKKGGLVRVGGC